MTVSSESRFPATTTSTLGPKRFHGRRSVDGITRDAAWLSGDASQKSSILVASACSILREIAHISTGSASSLRCDRGVLGATLTAAGALNDPDLVAEAHRQGAARHEIELLDLVVEVAGPLLEVQVRRHANQRHRQLLADQISCEPAELARGRRIPRSGPRLRQDSRPRSRRWSHDCLSCRAHTRALLA